MAQRCQSCGAFLEKNIAYCSRCGKPAAAGKKKVLLPILLGLADLGLLIWIIQAYLSS